jgi:hypothetical protein
MKISKILFYSLIFAFLSCNSNHSQLTGGVFFKEESYKFTKEQRASINDYITDAEIEVKTILPKLPDNINVFVELVDWDLDAVGGVTGRTESNDPPLVAIQLSKNYRGGNIDSLQSGIRSTIFHEYHHISRGWAIQDNKFSYGIPNAMVNEGLAVAFTEKYTGNIYEANSYTNQAHYWVEEILDLPLNANYSDWVMGEHPDGRTYIAYRTGNYLIHQAMSLSGKNILELSELMPDKIISLAGY